MRLPRMRFTVRCLMAVAALVALLLFASMELSRRTHRAAHYRQLAAEYGSLERVSRTSAQISEGNKRHYAGSPDAMKSLDAQVQSASRRADYYALLKTKYQGAAARPWEAIAPDPPGPTR